MEWKVLLYIFYHQNLKIINLAQKYLDQENLKQLNTDFSEKFVKSFQDI